MKTELKKVRHAGEVVGTVDIPVYGNMEELVDNETDERILNMFNKQNAVRIMGNERAKHTPTVMGKGKLWDMAFNTLTPEEAASYAGKVDELKEFLEGDVIAERVKKLLADTEGE